LSLRTRQELGSALVATSCRRSPDKQVTASSANTPGSPPGELAGLQLSRLSRALLHATGRLGFIPLENIARFVGHRPRLLPRPCVYTTAAESPASLASGPNGHDELPRGLVCERAPRRRPIGCTRIARGTAPDSRLSRRYQRARRDYRPRRMRTRAQQNPWAQVASNYRPLACKVRSYRRGTMPAVA
jgi:hypothetical protein